MTVKKYLKITVKKSLNWKKSSAADGQRVKTLTIVYIFAKISVI